MDAVGTSVFELAQTQASNASAGQQGNQQGNVTEFDVANFQEAMAKFDPQKGAQIQTDGSENQSAPATSVDGTPWSGMKEIGNSLLELSDGAGEVRSQAFESLKNADELSPGDMLALQVEVQKFSFHSQMSSTIANKASKGIQQLFRQQL